MNDERSQFSIMTNIMNDIVNTKRVTILWTTNSFAHKPDAYS